MSKSQGEKLGISLRSKALRMRESKNPLLLLIAAILTLLISVNKNFAQSFISVAKFTMTVAYLYRQVSYSYT